jgi:hypothetical protein
VVGGAAGDQRHPFELAERKGQFGQMDGTVRRVDLSWNAATKDRTGQRITPP